MSAPVRKDLATGEMVMSGAHYDEIVSSLQTAARLLSENRAAIAELMKKTHVVITRYLRPASQHEVVHSYGPYTQDEAQEEKRRMLAAFEAKLPKPKGRYKISVCKVIDQTTSNSVKHEEWQECS